MLVKICGITRPEDALAAVEAGADALGFVFWPNSPRFIDPYRARAIVSMLPPFVTAVGVFVNQPLDYVSGVAALVRLGAVQLHGDESASYAAALGRPVIKAIAVGDSAADVGRVARPRHAAARRPRSRRSAAARGGRRLTGLRRRRWRAGGE